MAKVHAFLADTVSDLRGGKESWRIFTIFSAISFAASVAVTLAR